jgi:hypothetical protein
MPLRLLDHLRREPARRQLLRLVLATQPDRLRRVIRGLGKHGALGSMQAVLGRIQASQTAGQLASVEPLSILLFLVAAAQGMVLGETMAAEVTGFDLASDDDWQRHRQALERLLRHGILATERSDP